MVNHPLPQVVLDFFSISSTRFSKPLSVLTISPKRLNAAIDLSQSRLSNAGIPEIILPGGTS